MAMLTLNGIVQNVLDVPARTDKKTGEIYPAKHQIQILAENDLPNGQKRLDLCLLYTSPSPRDRTRSRMPSSA